VIVERYSADRFSFFLPKNQAITENLQHVKRSARVKTSAFLFLKIACDSIGTVEG
jgi:hypothetical protein